MANGDKNSKIKRKHHNEKKRNAYLIFSLSQIDRRNITTKNTTQKSKTHRCWVKWAARPTDWWARAASCCCSWIRCSSSEEEFDLLGFGSWRWRRWRRCCCCCCWGGDGDGDESMRFSCCNIPPLVLVALLLSLFDLDFWWFYFCCCCWLGCRLAVRRRTGKANHVGKRTPLALAKSLKIKLIKTIKLKTKHIISKFVESNRI